MKLNLPVSERETEVAPGISLVSKTDLKGVITYANDAFIEVSGFARDELLGSSHNLVRHPEVPQAVFAQMWSSLHQGWPWRGTLKNRCKDGSFYWVNACVVPIKRQEQTIGYMSARQRASAEDIAQAEALFAGLKNPVKARAALRLPDWLGVQNGVRIGSLFVIVWMLLGGLLGVGGLHLSDTAIERLYNQQIGPASLVDQIEVNLSESRGNLLEMRASAISPYSPALKDQALQSGLKRLQAQRKALAQLMRGLGRFNDGQDPHFSALLQALTRYQQTDPAALGQALHSGSLSRAVPLIDLQLAPLDQDALHAVSVLRNQMDRAAQEDYQATLSRNRQIRILAISGILFGLVVVVLGGGIFTRGIIAPLNSAIWRLNRIAQGDLRDHSVLGGRGETAELNRAMTVTQLHLQVMLDEIALAAHGIQQSCGTLNTAVYEVAEHSEEQHDRVYNAVDMLDGVAKESGELSQRAEALLDQAALCAGATAETLPETLAALEYAVRELVTTVRLTSFGTEEAAGTMRQVAALVVDNRGEAQLAWQASQALGKTASELNQLVDFFSTTSKED